MSAHCCQDGESHAPLTWRPVLWLALAINAGMFLTEVVAGRVAGSVSLHADALDFLSDALNYGISLAVVGFALTWRARAALFKALTMAILGVWVLGEAVWNVALGRVPEPAVMGAIGFLALLANVGVAILLYRFRGAESNLRSAWVCSRNDALGNLAVLLAALGVFGTGSLWPDVIVAAAMAGLALQGSWTIFRQSLSELSAVAFGEIRS